MPLMQISPKLATEVAYFVKFKKKLNLKNPYNFNEKIQWLKLNYQTRFILLAADKVRVEDILREKKLEGIMIPRIGVYESVNQIPWEALPEKFVIKTNNASGTNIIVKNKEQSDIKKIKKQLQKWLKTNYSNYALEPQYQYMKPLILIEHLIESEEPLKDYRIFCFNGKPEFLYVSIDGEIDCDGFSNKIARKGYFDLEFNKLNFLKKETHEFDNITMPPNFNNMLEMSEKLSEGIPFVRVDFYNIDGVIYFGELTFTPSSGFTNYYKEEVLNELGCKIKLPTQAIKKYQ